jgi:AraC family cel operon transcriptional repressor
MYSVDVTVRHRVEALRFERHALGRPFHAATITFGPRARVSEAHEHADFYEVMGIVAGSGEQRLATGTQPLAAGDVVLVRPRDQHAIAGAPPDGMTFVNVAFPADAWRSFVDLTGVDASNAWERSAEPPLFTVPDHERGRMRAAFEAALSAFQQSPTMLDLVRFWSSTIELIADGSGTDDTHAAVRPQWLTRACVAMRREQNLRGGVRRLRELAAVSAAHLSRSMRIHYGMTPTRFVSDRRLQHAASLLARTSVSVTEIAYRCGYSSQSYFTRCFAAAHHMSPRAFRQRAHRAFVP